MCARRVALFALTFVVVVLSCGPCFASALLSAKEIKGIRACEKEDAARRASVRMLLGPDTKAYACHKRLRREASSTGA